MISRRQFLQAGAGALIAAGQRRSRIRLWGWFFRRPLAFLLKPSRCIRRASVLSRKLCRNLVIRR